MASAKQILVVDGMPVVRAGIGAFLAADGGLEVCGHAASPRAALALIAELEPDLVVTEVGFSDGARLDYLRDLRTRFPHVAVVVFSSLPEVVYGARAHRAGARGWVSKAEGADVLRGVVRQVLAGEETRPGAEVVSVLETLTDRELRVYELIGKGLGTSHIAETLHLSTKTIETHKAKLKRKLALQSSSELQVQAVEWQRITAMAPVKPSGEDPHQRGPYDLAERGWSYCLVSAGGEPVPLDPLTPLTIGRGQAAQVRLSSSFVSREQARIFWDVTRGFVLQELGSRNGTRVNGHPLVGECLLRDGDTLHVAGVLLGFRAIQQVGQVDDGDVVTDTWTF